MIKNDIDKELERKYTYKMPFWPILVILILIVGISWYTINKVDQISNYRTELRIIELNDNNVILEGSQILNIVCDDNVLLDRLPYPFRLFNNYAYLSTWRDGKVPHSKGVCAVKLRVRK